MSDPLGAEHPTPPVGLVARWVAASSLGELPGLGGVGLLAAGLVPAIQFLSVSVSRHWRRLPPTLSDGHWECRWSFWGIRNLALHG